MENLNIFESDEPKPQWLNQLKITISMAKRYEQKRDYQKAANCYETVLYYEPNDNRTRVRLSKCYQRLLQPGKAAIHQNYAMQNDPQSFQTVENEANVNLELGNIEQSLIAYSQHSKQWKTSYDCKQGLLKAKEIMNNNLPVESTMRRLRDSLLEMNENEQLFNPPISCDVISLKSNNSKNTNKSNNKRSQETYYHQNIIENVDFYRKQLNVLPNSNTKDKIIYERIKSIVQIYDKVQADLYQQNPFYIIKCQRSNRELRNRQRVKDMIKLQVAKYINVIVGLCLAGKIHSAQRQAELALKFMDERWYRPKKIMYSLYEVFGLAFYLVNQEIPEWSSELNEKRILFILGLNVHKNDAYENAYQESYFGHHDYNNTTDTVKKFIKHIKETELSTFSLYLQYELIKCHFRLKDFKRMKILAKHMFTDAYNLGSVAWQANALMMMVVSESRSDDTTIYKETLNNLKYLISLSTILGNENVTLFLRKILKLLSEKQTRLRVPVTDREGYKKSELISVMPDYESARLMRNLLHRNSKLPADCRMPLTLGESVSLKCTNAKRKTRF